MRSMSSGLGGLIMADLLAVGAEMNASPSAHPPYPSNTSRGCLYFAGGRLCQGRVIGGLPAAITMDVHEARDHDRPPLTALAASNLASPTWCLRPRCLFPQSTRPCSRPCRTEHRGQPAR